MNTRFYSSLEQSKRLKELGVVQDQSPFYWVKINDTGKPENDYWLIPIAEHTKFVRLDRKVITFPDNASYWINDKKDWLPGWCLEKYAAFSVGELGILIGPDYIMPFYCTEKFLEEGQEPNKFAVCRNSGKWDNFDNEAEARAELLLELIDCGSLSIEAINARYLKAIEQ